MKLQVHFPDLTEVGQFLSCYLPNEAPHYANYRPLDEALTLTEAQTKTELAFAHIPTNIYTDIRDILINGGWKEVTRSLNWHRYHKGDHPISLFIKTFKNKKSVEVGHVARYMNPGFTVNRRNAIFTFGCGGRLVNGMEEVMALRKACPKPLTLLRIPKTEIVNASNDLWLKKARYRVIASTSLADYYTNGQKPEIYDEGEERAFWKDWEIRKELLSFARKNKSVCEFKELV